MPARSIGTATISFGLVSVPVQVYSSAEPAGRSYSFNLLHKKCGTKLKQQYRCPKDEEIVSRDEMVKGYEFAKDQYVTFTNDEIKALDEKGDGGINVDAFVPLAKVDRGYVDKVYYLGPDKGGDRAYRLLAAALAETGRAALGQYAARGKQHLILLRPMPDGVIAMEQLFYPEELRSPNEVPLGDGEVKPAELALAKQIIEQGATDEFHPEKYHDVVRERVKEAIEQKVEGHEITAEPAREGGGKIIDLMEALKASLAKGAKGETGGDGEEEQRAAS
jgi:DNA end-binding protein Ku